VTTDRTPSPVREGNTESGNLESDWLPRRPKFFHLFLWNLALFKVSEFFTFFSSWNLASKCPQHFFFSSFLFFSLRKLGIQVSASLFFQNVILFIMMNQLAVITGRTRYEMGTLSQGTWNLIGFQGVRNFVPWPTETQLCT